MDRVLAKYFSRTCFKTGYNVTERMMVSCARRCEITTSSSAEGGSDGAIRSIADRSAVEENPPLLPKPPKRPRGGRPSVRNRRCWKGFCGFCGAGLAGRTCRRKFPHPSTCWRRLRDWEEQGVWLKIWRAFLSELNERQQLKWSESFLDGSFAPAKKGAAESEKPSGARGRSGWWWSTAAVFLWETTFTLHPRRKSSSRKRRSRRSG